MRILIDEQLPCGKVARALRHVSLDANAVGEQNWPVYGSSDSDVVACTKHAQAVLVTANFRLKDQEMTRALLRHQPPVVFLNPQALVAREVLTALLVRWEEIEGYVRAGRKAGTPTVLDLNVPRHKLSARTKLLDGPPSSK